MVMPLWDENPFTKVRKPWMTWTLIAANILVFVIEVSGSASEIEAFFNNYALTPLEITSPQSFREMLPADISLITYMFLHADIIHLFGNMIFLFVFGDDVEDALGSFRFLIFYLACGVVGALVFTASAPYSTIPLVGASGACSGVIMAYLMLRPCASIRVMFFPFFFRLSAYWVIGMFVLVQLFQVAIRTEDQIAYWCHIGGLIAGGVLFPLMRRPGVELFQCIERRDEPPPAVLPETTLSGVPREPTVR